MFSFFQFDNSAVTPASANSFADYPTLGIDSKALYVGVNVFSTTTSGFLRTDGYVIRKSAMSVGGSLVLTAFRGLVPTNVSDGPLTPQGVDNYDPASNEGYFIGVRQLGLQPARRPARLRPRRDALHLLEPHPQHPADDDLPGARERTWGTRAGRTAGSTRSTTGCSPPTSATGGCGRRTTSR